MKKGKEKANNYAFFHYIGYSYPGILEIVKISKIKRSKEVNK